MLIANDTLTFYPASHDPVNGLTMEDTYVIFNQCDGYHLVYAQFDEGVFEYFRDFIDDGRGYAKDFYCAWAKLPGGMQLFDIFAVKNPQSNYRAEESAVRTMKILNAIKDGS